MTNINYNRIGIMVYILYSKAIVIIMFIYKYIMILIYYKCKI